MIYDLGLETKRVIIFTPLLSLQTATLWIRRLVGKVRFIIFSCCFDPHFITWLPIKTSLLLSSRACKKQKE